MRGGVAAKRRCRGARIEAVRDCRRRLAAGEVNAHLRIGLDVAKPLRAGTETGDHDVAARRRMINHLQHDVATTPGLAPNVLEHQKSRSQQNTKPGSVEPDRRPNEPTDAEQGCTGTSGWIPAPGGHRTHLSSQPVRRVPDIRYSVSMVDRSAGISPSSTSVGSGSAEVSPHHETWHAARRGASGSDDPEPGSFEHRLCPDERHGQVHPSRRVDGVGLHRRRAVRRGVGDRALQQWCRHALSPMTRADDDAHDAPHTGTSSTGRMSRERARRVISARGPTLHHPTGSPSRYVTTPGGYSRSHRRRMASSRLPPPAARSRRLQPVRQAPAVVDAATAVDHVSEVLEPVRCHRMRVPTHELHPTTSRPPITGAEMLRRTIGLRHIWQSSVGAGPDLAQSGCPGGPTWTAVGHHHLAGGPAPFRRSPPTAAGLGVRPHDGGVVPVRGDDRPARRSGGLGATQCMPRARLRTLTELDEWTSQLQAAIRTLPARNV